MAKTANYPRLIPGPCVLCGIENYGLSMGGPTICPACDCGGAEAGLQQRLRIANLEILELKAEVKRLKEQT